MVSRMFRSDNGSPLYLAASANHNALSSSSLSGFSAARSWHWLRSASMWNSSQRSASKCDQPAGVAACTVLANQPSCQMPRVPSMV